MTDDLIGRQPEIAALDTFLKVSSERSSTLLIEGEPGIGKSRLWRHALEDARSRGFRCLVARPGGADVELAFAGLADLLRDVDDSLIAGLPAPQRRALSVALLLVSDDGAPPDEFAVAAAFLGVLRRLAMRSRVLVAVDDLQWLDSASVRLLEFALRRLDAEPVGSLFTRRVDEGTAWPRIVDAVDEGRRARVHVGPLSLGGLHELVRSRLGVKLGRATLQRVHETSAGNPFFALQLVEALGQVGTEVPPGQPLPVPADLRELIAARLGLLSERARETLLICAALARPSVPVVEAAVADPGGVAADLDEAETAGIVVRVDSEIRFTHPLLASVHVSSFPVGQRRSIHRRLAEVARGREERARHLALAASRPDPGVASELEAAGAEAHARGAIRAEAELLGQAVTLTPAADQADRLRRSVAAARAELASGDADRAKALLDAALDLAPPGPQRAEVLNGLGKLLLTKDVRRSMELLQEAAHEAASDDQLRAKILCSLSKFVYGHLVGYEQSEAWAREAVDLADRADDRGTQALALALVGHSVFLRGGGVPTDVMERAIALEAAGGGLDAGEDSSPAVIYAEMLIDVEQTDRAREMIEQAAETWRHAGEAGLGYALHLLAFIEFDAGRWERARSVAAESLEISVLSGQETTEVLAASILGTIEGALGEVETARRRLEGALALATRTGRGGRAPRHGLGLLELSIEDYAAAWGWLEPAIDRILPLGLTEPSPQVCDGVEALAQLGRVDDAARLLAGVEEPARRLDRRRALAAVARDEGLIRAARDDLAGAEHALEEAVEIGRPLALPFELGRSLLALGSVRRRLQRKQAARATLDEAFEVLERLGAENWAERARRESARIGGRLPPKGELSSTEEQIADLVGLGRSNKEIALALKLSVKTVEWNLTRLYRKLGVESRTELVIARRREG